MALARALTIHLENAVLFRRALAGGRPPGVLANESRTSTRYGLGLGATLVVFRQAPPIPERVVTEDGGPVD